MADAWRTATLGEAAIIVFSGVDKHTIPGETPVRLCNYLDVYRNRRLTNGMEFARGSARPAEIARCTLRKGDVLITKDSETPDDIGVPSVVEDDLNGVICGYHLALLRPEAEKLTSHFLLHYLQSDATKRHFLRTANGLTRFGLGARAVASLPIALPLPDEQAAIARILDAVDTSLERTRAAVERARELERSVLEDAFKRLEALPRRLREFTTDVRYGTSKASSDRGWGNPVLRIPNVVGDRLSLGDLAFVELPPAEVDRLRLQDGDLLLVRTNGNPNYVGRSVVFCRPDERTWVYASYLIRVRLNDGLMPDFLNVFLGTERGRRELLRRVTTSAGNHNINSNSIRLISLPAPDSRRAQDRIVQLADACRSHVDALQKKGNALEQLKKSLMDDLLTGRVRVTSAIEGSVS
jgi:type I restriction enzyme S subunit